MTMEEEQAALSPHRIAGLVATGLQVIEYRRYWATRMNALGTIFLCRGGLREYIATLFLGESMACHFVSPELAAVEAVRASIERDVADPRFGRAWAGEWVALPHTDGDRFAFTQR
ncbi:hypothetical protein [Limnoglobus roseus]|uniref:Uncharacterized protein n=1 Tax=Limnoglobus roseus TaxID=2598579 RepID=A0A5C1AAZ2_9BACT|nr:hypothetical protein [Limnoglobus roseus]QEL15890.1 hypothetical protein PX52LOC_02826 [Limnoglobus roseus]